MASTFRYVADVAPARREYLLLASAAGFLTFQFLFSSSKSDGQTEPRIMNQLHPMIRLLQ